MPAEYGDKTEAPTPRRRTEARERGQVVRSPDLSAAVVLLGSMIALKIFGPALVATLLNVLSAALDSETAPANYLNDLPRIGAHVAWALAVAALPVVLVILVLAVIANLAQVGPLLTAHPLRPTLNKINPLAGFGRLFSMRSTVQLAANLAKIALVVAVAYQVVMGEAPRILAAVELDVWEMLAVAADATLWLGIKLGLVLLVLALFDYFYHRWQHERDLRMTKEEVKEEMRRMEGDPIMKQRRRQIQLQMTLQKLRRDVPRADVVITNPTELAVALRYDDATMRAPAVVAKGAGYVAQRIRELAIAHGVPIIERKPLAQTLYKLVEVGQEIPSHLYQAVAEILAYVYELSGRRRVSRARA